MVVIAGDEDVAMCKAEHSPGHERHDQRPLEASSWREQAGDAASLCPGSIAHALYCISPIVGCHQGHPEDHDAWHAWWMDDARAAQKACGRLSCRGHTQGSR